VLGVNLCWWMLVIDVLLDVAPTLLGTSALRHPSLENFTAPGKIFVWGQILLLEFDSCCEPTTMLLFRGEEPLARLPSWTRFLGHSRGVADDSVLTSTLSGLVNPALLPS